MGPIIFAITIVLFFGYAVLIIYYRQSWLQIPEYNSIPGSINKIPSTKITVIIPARNEEQYIGRCLQSIIDQSYPTSLFEIIVIDDHSTDNTANVVRSFNNQNIHLIFLKDFVSDAINAYKKKAIEVAIAQSKGDLIVTTDADCFMDKEWLKTVASFYEEYRPACIAAPVSINSTNHFVQIFQALDFMTLQGITGAAVYKKIHSMCNGANFAYEKNAYYKVSGFKGIDNIASGDDMLLMHKIYKLYPDRVLFLKSREAIVHTQPMNTWKGFFNQRIRWASKADQYDDKRILPVLMLVYFFNLLLLLLPVIAIFYNSTLPLFNYQSDRYRITIIDSWLLVLALKTIIELFFLFPIAKFFNRHLILWWFPLAQPFHILYTIIAGCLGKFGEYSWKSRTVK
jgi:cellulose synthase/poly-beta-1,6-N-acetylglucosamine synthase-like glycosyltransferase